MTERMSNVITGFCFFLWGLVCFCLGRRKALAAVQRGHVEFGGRRYVCFDAGSVKS